MKVSFMFNASKKSSRSINIGNSILTMNLKGVPYSISGKQNSAKTEFKKGEKIEVEFFTLVENGKEYHTDKGFNLVALEDTITATENLGFMELTTHTTIVDIDIDAIKNSLYSYNQMSQAKAAFFDDWNE